jgi:hypothetical protein
MKKKPVRWEIFGQQITRNCGGLVCKVGGDFYDDGRLDRYGKTFDPPLDTKANAALIAAAPELADACRFASRMMTKSLQGTTSYCPKLKAELRRGIRACEAALAKAEAKA